MNLLTSRASVIGMNKTVRIPGGIARQENSDLGAASLEAAVAASRSERLPEQPQRLDVRRLWMAFALTPLLSGFYPALFLAEPAVMPIGLVLAYLSAGLFGLPLVLLFDRRHWRSWWQFAIGGAVCALPTLLLYAALGSPEHLQPFGAFPALGLLFWGCTSGLVFWLLGVAGETPVTFRSLFDPIEPR